MTFVRCKYFAYDIYIYSFIFTQTVNFSRYFKTSKSYKFVFLHILIAYLKNLLNIFLPYFMINFVLNFNGPFNFKIRCNDCIN